MTFLHENIQVHGVVISSYWVCTWFYDTGKWLLPAPMCKQFSGGIFYSLKMVILLDLFPLLFLKWWILLCSDFC